jgi:hypothetical protein
MPRMVEASTALIAGRQHGYIPRAQLPAAGVGMGAIRPFDVTAPSMRTRQGIKVHRCRTLARPDITRLLAILAARRRAA